MYSSPRGPPPSRPAPPEVALVVAMRGETLAHLGLSADHGDPVRVEAITNQGWVSSGIDAAVHHDLNLVVGLKGVSQVLVQVLLAAGD